MPAEVRRGPFSYDADLTSSNNTYGLTSRTSFDVNNGEILEVLVDGAKIQGEGGSISGTVISGDGFIVNSLANPTSISLVSASTSAKVTIRRLSNRSTPQVDFAPGSVIREQDLDNSTNQTLHVAQEAMDIALQSISEATDGEWDGKSKVIKNVANGVADNDAVNMSQMDDHDAAIEQQKVTTLAYQENTEDYKLEAKDWADKVDAGVKAYTANNQTGSVLGYSAKEYAQGDGNSDAISIGGSAKGWAQDPAKVNGATTNDRSAKAWSQGASMTGATLGGSSKDWANTLVTQIDGTYYSAKENATGVTTADGSAKQWALGGGGSFTEATAVQGDNYSARKYASDASASETAAANSAAAVSQVYDSFNDVYLGSMRNDKTSADAVTLTGASWAKDSSSIAFTGISSGAVTIGQELTTTSGSPNVYPVDANIIGTQLTTPIVISKPFTVAGTGATLTFVGTGVYGAFNDSTGGPSLNNDGDALVDGNLYFNSQQNEMRIWQGSEWIAATAVGQTSLNEYKFVTNANQVDAGHAAYKTYTGTADVGGTLSYTQDNIIVFMNGVQLKKTIDYVANGTSIVLVNAPVLNDEIAVIAFKSFTTSDMVSKTNGGTFAGAVTFSSGLTGDVTGTATTATNVTVADESSDTTCFPLFVTGATGGLAPKSGSNLIFNSSTGLLQATQLGTTDLILNNTESMANEVDGTSGHWCVQEGDSSLFIINRITNKKYKFKLEEIND